MQTTIARKPQQHLMLVFLLMAIMMWAIGGMWRWGVVAALVLIVPGQWLQIWVGLPSNTRLVRGAMTAVVGPMLLALAYMWAAALQVALPLDFIGWMLWGGAGVLLWRQWRDDTPHQSAVWPSWWWMITLLGIGGAVVWTRQQQIAALVLPAWVDGVHHSLLVRVAYERQQAPWDLRPYVDVPVLTFHSGYHSMLAAMMDWAGIAVSDVGTYVLATGQVLNVLAVVSVAVLVWYWWRSWAGVSAALLVCGLFSIMPAYYVAWGRYTLLMGMVLLPIAVMVLDDFWQRDTPRVAVWLALVAAGLALTHVVVFAMWLLWGVVLLLTRGWPRRTVWYGAGVALLLTGPWWWIVVMQTRAGAGASAMNVVGNDTHNVFIVGLFWALNNQWLIPALAVLCGLAIRRHSRVMRDVVLWMALVAVCANPPWLGLPYISFFTNETMTTALYVPIGIAAAWAWVHLNRLIPSSAVALATLVVALVVAPSIQTVVRDETVLTTTDDLAALRWMQSQEWPASTRVLTSAQRWMWGVDRGDDGGWWILPLVGVSVTTPPVLYTYGDDATVQQIAAYTARVRDGDGSLAMLADLLAADPTVTHVYASEHGAQLHPQVLRESPLLEEVYSTGDVAIFRVKRADDAQ